MTISSDEMDRTFRQTLRELAGDVPGLRALDCGTWGTAAPLARLCFDGQRGSYYVHAALRADAGLRAERWSTRVSALYVSQKGDGERRYALDVLLSGETGARDGRLLGTLVLTAVLADQREHSGGPAAR